MPLLELSPVQDCPEPVPRTVNGTGHKALVRALAYARMSKLVPLRAPRISLVVLRSLCEKGRARPPPELARLFALDKFIFWRVLAFWRNDRDLPHHITTREREPPQNEYFD